MAAPEPSEVKFGALLPQAGWSADRESLITFAQRAEELGYSSVWVGDHVCLPARQESAYPYGDDPDRYEVPSDRPFLEAMVTLGFVAAVTSRVTLGVSVGIIPYRHPLLWAKSLATIQRLSGDRLILGAGVGWLEEEFAALGVDYRLRGALTDDSLALLQAAWQSSPVSYKGQFFEVRDMYVVPPVRDAGMPPVWVGGNGSIALKRTARFGDVWHPHIRGCSPQDVTSGLSRVRAYSEGLDRPRHFTAALHIPVKLTAVASNTPPWDVGAIVGSAEFLREWVDQYTAVGVEHFVFSFGGSLSKRLSTLESIASAVQ